MKQKMYKILILLLFLHFSAWGHAHIFIDYKLHAIATAEGLQGIYVNWTFDRMFASFIKKEFDIDKNGKLSKEEQQEIYKKSFLEWKKDDYFGVIKLNNKKVVFPTTQKFSARLAKQGDVVEYTFYIPLNIKAGDTKTRCSFHFIDPVIYVDFSSSEKDITVNNKAKETIHFEKAFEKDGFTNQAVFTIEKK